VQQDDEMDHIVRIARHFLEPGQEIDNAKRHGNGIIHDTYLVTPGKGQGKFILQRLNAQVFKKPELVMQNIRTVCDHIHDQLTQEESSKFTDWQMLEIIRTNDGRDYLVDADGSFWRGLSFIYDALPLEKVKKSQEAIEIGRALGRFHFLVNDLDPARLSDPLPGFHNIGSYLTHYDQVVKSCNKGDQSANLQYCQRFIDIRRKGAQVLENALEQGRLQLRITHGDPKSNNVLLDARTGTAVSIIDLDTVRPGLVIIDIADCLRSCCNSLDEDAGNPETVCFDADLCKALLRGYTTENHWLTDSDFKYLYDAIRLIAFELGLRFVTDFLESDVYFKTDYNEHNLDRAMVQFKLAKSIELQEAEIKNIIADCRVRYME
jgi:Ser/Thr protein kinase RdoA (MazF antagonist)